jgi:hypothetical protein
MVEKMNVVILHGPLPPKGTRAYSSPAPSRCPANFLLNIARNAAFGGEPELLFWPGR